MFDADAEILTAGTTVGFTIIVKEFDVAVGVEGQFAVEVIIHETTSALFNAVLTNVVPVEAFIPLIFH
jgi:hypothetical protein